MFNKTNTEAAPENVTMEAEKDYETKALEIEAEETAVLKTLLEKQEKQLFYSRISGIAMSIMALALVVVSLIIIPKVLSTLSTVDSLLDETEVAVSSLEATINDTQSLMSDASTMILEITAAADGINTLVEDNSELLTDSVSKMNSIDFDGLNEAIGDLQAVVEPFANFFGKFK